MPVFLRFLMLLALVVWVGGITFFSVLAPNVSAVLPTRKLGQRVNRMLPILHWMGLVSGVVFVAASMLYSRIMTGFARPLAGRHILVLVMLLLTVISQFMIVPRMAALRADMANITPSRLTTHAESNSIACMSGPRVSSKACSC